MFGPHFQSEKREGYSGRCYNRHSFRPCLQGVNVSREEGSLAYPYYPGRANVLSRFTWQNLARTVYMTNKKFSRPEGWPGVLTTCMEKPDIPVGKSNGSRYSVLPWVPEAFLACGGNFRCWPKADTSLAVGRSHERQVTIKTWQKPETALDKSLAPRVHPFGTLQETWAVIWGDGIFGSLYGVGGQFPRNAQ